MIRGIKRSIVWKGLTYLMLVNFINLSANFYHASEMDSLMLEHEDPIDSIAELVLEYFFEMDDETIPDTEVPHEKRKMGDIKQLYVSPLFSFQLGLPQIKLEYHNRYEASYEPLTYEITSPPPKSV